MDIEGDTMGRFNILCKPLLTELRENTTNLEIFGLRAEFKPVILNAKHVCQYAGTFRPK
jgi:hypothetical protein